jgi:putative inorganic carbon (HCO3(-)) transporter
MLAALCLVMPLGMFPPEYPLFLRLPWLIALQRRLPDTFNVNIVAGVLIILLPFSIARTVIGRPKCPKRWLDQGFALLTSLLAFVILASSGSRAGVFTMLVTLLIFVGFMWPRPVLIAAAVLLVAVVIGGTWYGWHEIAQRLLLSRITGGLELRIELWSRALYIIRDYPFTGIGMGCFDQIVPKMYPLFLFRRGTQTHAHNLFLQVAVDLGLFGLAAYLVILGTCFCAAGRAYRMSKGQRLGDLELLSGACLSSLAGMCIYGLLNSAAWGSKGAFISWVIMAVSLACYRIAKQVARAAEF